MEHQACLGLDHGGHTLQVCGRVGRKKAAGMIKEVRRAGCCLFAQVIDVGAAISGDAREEREGDFVQLPAR
ncbi:hypothetical protein ABZ848_46135 [Streptomyces sp. NPDC047081]|uniref:hypothetical protein n=1 Tax=Streptomyces sp. NPDC047081 TaxID=3154706 RepID=UPI0033C63072